MAFLARVFGGASRAPEIGTQPSEGGGDSPVEKKVSNISKRLQMDLAKFGDYYNSCDPKDWPDLKGLPPGTFYLNKSKYEDRIILRYVTDVKIDFGTILIQEEGLLLSGSSNKFQKLKHLLKHYKDISEHKLLVSRYTRAYTLKMNETRVRIKATPAFKDTKKIECAEIEQIAKEALHKAMVSNEVSFQVSGGSISNLYLFFQNNDDINEFTLLFKIRPDCKDFTKLPIDKDNIGEIKMKIKGIDEISFQVAGWPEYNCKTISDFFEKKGSELGLSFRPCLEELKKPTRSSGKAEYSGME